MVQDQCSRNAVEAHEKSPRLMASFECGVKSWCIMWPKLPVVDGPIQWTFCRQMWGATRGLPYCSHEITGKVSVVSFKS